ncbi:hypothetical protein [Rhodoblastus sp.]|jgi:hypothetical protein|uniref:hypothetical protein n=1 Tax=Rhodoblastus sp. TaxID=1962975 RepID=UPI0025F70F18|nr:hypothetical protein [Rhodoblastus sp.]
MAQSFGLSHRGADIAQDPADFVDLHAVRTDLNEAHWMDPRAYRKRNAESGLCGRASDLMLGFLDGLAGLGSPKQKLVFANVRAQLHLEISMEVEHCVADIHYMPQANIP